MKRIVALLAAPLLLASLAAPAATPLPDGFHGLKWRAPVAAGMKLRADVSAGDNASYTRPNDTKTLETDAGQGAKLLKAFTAQWGEPKKKAENVFVWEDAGETMVIFRGTDLEGSSSRAEIFIVCKPLVEQATRAAKDRPEKLLGIT